MASRKDQKEQARAARIAQEQAAAADAQRKRRIQILGGTVTIAVIAIAVAIVLSVGGGNGAPKGAVSGIQKGKQKQTLVSSVQTLLKGIPQSGNTLGNPHAKVTMQYFGDLECPICQAFTLTVFPQFVQDQVRTGHVKVEYRSMCTATCGVNFTQAINNAIFNRQQIAAYAAGKQDKFWQYAELFYHQQQKENTGYPTDAWLTALAKEVPGLNLNAWQTERKDPALLDEVNADQSYASKAGLPGTPSLIMKGPKGETLVNGGNYATYSQLAKAVQTVG
jgi:protein-disulfide isomerase